MTASGKLALLSVFAAVPACQSPPDTPVLGEWRFVEDFRIGGGADDPEGFSDLRGVELPFRTEFVEAKGNHVWAIQRGEDDEQYVVRYRIAGAFQPR